MTIRYHQSGLWIEQSGDTYTIGISEKGQDDIGEVMFVDLPKYGKTISEKEVLIGVEGAKAVTEINAPLSGTVKAVHEPLEDEPELLNSEAKEDNWIIELTDVDGDAFDALDNEQIKKEA